VVCASLDLNACPVCSAFTTSSLPTGLADFVYTDAALHHLLLPAFIVPQLLNLSGSVLFALSLSGDISIAAPVANGVSLAANAAVDHLLGDGTLDASHGLPGLLLVLLGVTLCTLASGGN
jgi:hypothetical protein